MIELKRLLTPLTAIPASMPPPPTIKPAAKRKPRARIRTTPSMSTATKRIQKPAGRVAAETGVAPAAGGLGWGGGNEAGGAAGGAARSAPHRAQERASSPRPPQRPHVTAIA